MVAMMLEKANSQVVNEMTMSATEQNASKEGERPEIGELTEKLVHQDTQFQFYL